MELNADHHEKPAAPRRRALPTTLIGVGVLTAILGVSTALQGGGVVGRALWAPDVSLSLGKPKNAMTMPPGGTEDMFKPRTSTSGVGQAIGTSLIWVFLGLVVLGLVLIGLFVARKIKDRKRRRSLVVPVETLDVDVLDDEGDEAPSAPVLKEGFELALDVLDTETEASDAVVKSWQGLQQAAARSGVRRQPAETPAEFTRRILGRLRADTDAVETLLGLYQGVRFGGREATPEDIGRAREALQTLSANWGQAAGGSTPDPLAGGALLGKGAGS